MTEAWKIEKADRVAILEAVSTAREAGAQGRYLMAVATGLVVKADAIGTGRVYATQGDYADALGVSAATVSGLKNLAVAVDLGLTPGYVGWKVISSKAGNIGKACRDPKASLSKIHAAAKAAKAADEKAADEKAKAKAKAQAAPRATADEKAGEAGEESTALPVATAALGTLRSVMADLDAAGLVAIRNGLTGVLEEYNAAVKAVPTVKAS